MSIPEIPILYQDDCMVLVHKPAGMLVHRGMWAPKEELFLLQLVRDQIGKMVYPVHRLDRPTSGLVLFALSSTMAHALQTQWQQGAVQKTYHAIIRGWMPTVEGLHCEALDDPDSGILQEAQTRWKILQTCTLPIAVSKFPEMRLSLVELEPITGRYHQLRRHFSRLQHPIIGDTTHGDRHHNHCFWEQLGLWQLMLCATRIRFAHPETGVAMDFSDEPSRNIQRIWEQVITSPRVSEHAPFSQS